MSRGWSIVVDARDASCRLSHLATGATAALPSLNAVRQSGSDAVTHLTYLHRPDFHTAIRNSCMVCRNYLQFTDLFRFAVHVPLGVPPAAAAAGMTIMMYHIMLGPWGTGMSSRPVAFDVFELRSTPDGLAWLEVRDAGNYELFHYF